MTSCTQAGYKFFELNNGTANHIIPLKTYRRIDAQLFILNSRKYIYQSKTSLPTRESDIRKTRGTCGVSQGSTLWGPNESVLDHVMCVRECTGSYVSELQPESECLAPLDEAITQVTEQKYTNAKNQKAAGCQLSKLRSKTAELTSAVRETRSRLFKPNAV